MSLISESAPAEELIDKEPPPMYALPVVVAPPFTVRPPACVPSPIVEEAYAVRPPLNWVSVEVAFPARPNGYAKAEPLPVGQVVRQMSPIRQIDVAEIAVVEANVNLFRPVQELLSARMVDEAAPAKEMRYPASFVHCETFWDVKRAGLSF